MKKLVIAAGGIVIVIVAGFFLYRHFVINSIMDGPFMENISPDESETETVSDPESASAREPEAEAAADPESASAQEPESASALDSKLLSARTLPETAALVEFSWHQSAMSHDDCFDFWMKTTEENPETPYLYCSYTDPESRERIELGDEMFIYRAGRQKKGGAGVEAEEAESKLESAAESESEGKLEAEKESGANEETEDTRCPKIPHERWQELSAFLKNAELAPYKDPDPNLLDGTDSKLELTWSADEQQFTESLDGRSADGLLELLQDITKGF